jgi:hypothetical protein
MKNQSAKSARAPVGRSRAASKTASPAKKSPRRTSAARTKGKAAPPRRATTARKAPAKKTAARRKTATLSPRAQKKRAMQHFQKLLEEKQLRDTQTPAWRALEHHDHSAPMSPPRKI